jgi:hypothetical protein
VPPPPAGGGAVGNVLADELGAVGGSAVCGVEKAVEGLDDGVVRELGVEPRPGVELPPVAGVVLPPVAGVVLPPVAGVVFPELVGSVVGPTEPEIVAEGMVGDVVDEEPPLHAEIATNAIKVSAPAPAILTLSVIPAMVARPFIGPPCVDSFPGPGFANPRRND